MVDEEAKAFGEALFRRVRSRHTRLPRGLEEIQTDVCRGILLFKVSPGYDRTAVERLTASLPQKRVEVVELRPS